MTSCLGSCKFEMSDVLDLHMGLSGMKKGNLTG